MLRSRTGLAPCTRPRPVEGDQSTGRKARCFRWTGILRDATMDPDYRRHYGGQDPESNGSNFAFANGHVKWHSALEASEGLVCGIDVGLDYNRPIPGGFQRESGCRGSAQALCSA